MKREDIRKKKDLAVMCSLFRELVPISNRNLRVNLTKLLVIHLLPAIPAILYTYQYRTDHVILIYCSCYGDDCKTNNKQYNPVTNNEEKQLLYCKVISNFES